MGEHVTFFKDPPLTAAQRQAIRHARRHTSKAVKFGRLRVRDNASNSPDLPLSKGRTIDEDTAESHAAEVKQIRKTRVKVWKRTDHCEYCGDSERETAEKSPVATHQMHEDPSRAKTRGLPPEERFNAAICGRVCSICHPLLTENVIRAHFHDEVKRHTSDYDVIDVASGHILRHMRRGFDSRIAPSLNTGDL